MNNFMVKIRLALLMAAWMTMPALAQQNFQTLDAIKVDDTTVIMSLSGETKHYVLKISNPPRLVVEFTNTEHNIKEKEILVNNNLIKRVRSGQFQNEPIKLARVVVELPEMVDYELEGNGRVVKLVLNPSSDSLPARMKASSVPPTDKKSVSRPASTAASGIAAPANSVSTPAIQHASTTTETEKVTPGERKAAKSFPKPVASEPPSKASPLPQVTSKDTREDNEMIAEPATGSPRASAPLPDKKNNEKKTKTSEKAEPQPQPAVATPVTSDRVVLPKQPITLDFEEADIRDVLRILSMKSGINVIYGNDVSGPITIRLENVPFDRAFDTILSLKGLVSQEQGPNILRVTTPQHISEERSQAVTFTKVYPLNYAKADEVKSNLDSIRSAEGRRGNTAVDQRTNSLIITDTPEGLSSAEKIIAELDKKPQQVIIEAKIVEIVLNNSLDLGIEWAYARSIPTSNGVMTVGKTSIESTQTQGVGGTQVSGEVRIPQSPIAGGAGLSFPAAAASGQLSAISFGLIEDSSRLTAMITTLAQKGLSKLLSNPKVTTINNQQARILVGQRIPYTTTTVSQSGSTQQTNFLDVGVKLTVTPTINADKKITLQVHPEVSLYVRADPAGPVIGTREAQTTVLVNDGETVVIGGLITDDDRKLGSQVPLLGDLPVIGHLFKRDFNTKDRTELLVFLTPQIIKN